MTNPTAASNSQQRRDELRTRADQMIKHLRTEVLPVPGRRAAVRAALGQEPGDPRTFRAYREISEFLPPSPFRLQERAFFAVAAMLCAQPASNRRQEITVADPAKDDSRQTGTREQRSLGGSCAQVVNRGRVAQKSMEARLHQLCRVGATGVHRQLPRVVHHLRGVGVEINWVELIDDLAAWEMARDHIAARWLREFYRGLTARSATQNPTTDDASQEDPS